MHDIVIKSENLGKKYTIGHQAEGQGGYVALRDVIARNARALWRSAKDVVRGRPIIIGDETEEVWALKGVDFEVRRGEALGVIGRNGAGKSTLLKVLSRITEPTEGRVTIKGRVASLLEVGTGFHPELTGRENIYLNGAILGMTRAEIRSKYAEIVDFAGVEKYIDTPVKRYSSGMRVRLAFAVAAHLEPEILLVDEVLAVGDAEFQKKCLGKMQDVAGHGRTVLFVSHNMGAVNTLCDRAILLESGGVQCDGPTEEVVSEYLSSAFPGDVSVSFPDSGFPSPDSPVVLHGIRICSMDGNSVNTVAYEDDHFIEFDYTVQERMDFLRVGFWVTTIQGVEVFASFDSDDEDASCEYRPGRFVAKCVLPKRLLHPGIYFLSVRMNVPRKANIVPLDNVLRFEISGTELHRSERHGRKRRGLLKLPLEWQRQEVSGVANA